jgi:hypothetical protein
MRRKGSVAKVVLVVAVLVLLGAGAFAIWWWSGREDPVEAQVVADAADTVAAYLVEQPHPKLGNFERLTGAGFDHTRYGTPETRALRANRLAHFTKGDSGTKNTLELIILVVPAQDGGGAGRAAVTATEEDGRKFIVTHPKYRG